MKEKKVCSKCSSKNVYKVPGGAVNGLSSAIYNNYIYRGLMRKPVRLTRYLCSDCGYAEEWIDDKKDVEKIKDYYKQVLPIFKNGGDSEKEEKKEKKDK